MYFKFYLEYIWLFFKVTTNIFLVKPLIKCIFGIFVLYEYIWIMYLFDVRQKIQFKKCLVFYRIAFVESDKRKKIWLLMHIAIKRFLEIVNQCILIKLAMLILTNGWIHNLVYFLIKFNFKKFSEIPWRIKPHFIISFLLKMSFHDYPYHLNHALVKGGT